MSTGPALSRTRERLVRAADSASSVNELFASMARVLREVTPLDGWCGHTLDPATSMPTGGDAREGYAPELLSRLLEIEYGVGDVNPFNDLLQRPEPVGVLRDATNGDPARSARYREVITPSGFEHELRAVFRHQGRPWGAFVAIRADDAPPFTTVETELLASVSTAMATAVKRLLLQAHVDSGGVPDSAGLLLLDAELHISTCTPEAGRWLSRLAEREICELPLSVVALARSAVGQGTTVRSRVRTSEGAWITMTAWSLDGGRVAISLEPAAPHDLTAIALEAYSLSPREREVVQLVLLGLSTAEIGRRLFLSPYTVQDHLKAVFEKTGVRSRRELAADLFFRHYLPRIERGTPLNAEGWFAEG